MAFPKTFLGFRIGWKDKGETNLFIMGEEKYTEICRDCRTRLRFGWEDNQLFWYCPMHMTKVIPLRERPNNEIITPDKPANES